MYYFPSTCMQVFWKLNFITRYWKSYRPKIKHASVPYQSVYDENMTKRCDHLFQNGNHKIILLKYSIEILINNTQCI